MPRQSGTRPDLTPGIACDQVLEFFVERIPVLERSVHVGVAQNGAPHGHSLFIPLAIIHADLAHASRKFETSIVNASAASMFDKWAAGSSLYCAPGICCSMKWPSDGGATGSCVPEIIRVGTRIREIASRRSVSRSAAQQPV